MDFFRRERFEGSARSLADLGDVVSGFFCVRWVGIGFRSECFFLDLITGEALMKMKLKSELRHLVVALGVVLVTICLPGQTLGQPPLEEKAPMEGVKKFVLGPPLATAPPKRERPDWTRENVAPAGGGSKAVPAQGNVTKIEPAAPTKLKNHPKAPKEMTVTAVPLPPDKIAPVEKNLPESFHPRPPRTLPVKQGKISSAEASSKERKKRFKSEVGSGLADPASAPPN